LGLLAQPASNAASATAARAHPDNLVMAMILLEALGALALLLFIVWWTMFSGRKGGERRDDDQG
jgi:hypothetical protein